MVGELLRYGLAEHFNPAAREQQFHFKYFGFEWVQAPTGGSLTLLFVVVLLGAAGIAIGAFYRACAAAFAIGFTWLFLNEAARYLNHFYVICLLAFLAILLPANRRLSLDCLCRPHIRSDVVPAWTLWLMRAQVTLVYFYGGVAKVNGDWLRGEPIRSWMRAAVERNGWSPFWSSETIVALVSYGGLAFDLAIVPLLLWRKTRFAGFVAAVAFHLTNSVLFRIGIFPWLGIALTALYFSPSWPRSLVGHIYARCSVAGIPRHAAHMNMAQFGFRRRGIVIGLLALYLSWQTLMPLRHFLYPGEVSWTEEGHRFSWHMKLRSKRAEARFFILDPRTTEVWALDPLVYLSPRQYAKMAGSPDMILQFAHYIAKLMRESGHPDVHVHTLARVSLNGRPPALLIDPDVNLVAVHQSIGPSKWILPLSNSRQDPAWLLPAGSSTVTDVEVEE